MTYRKKLIEVALPLEAINREAAREKSIRHGHPSTLHLWWARRPLAAARAVIFAQMVDDPSGYVDTLKSDPKLRRQAEGILKARHKRWAEATAVLDKARKAGISAPEPGPEPKLDDILAEIERQRLFRIIEELVQWENTTNEEVLKKARDEIWQSWRRACAQNAGHPRAKELFDRNKLPPFHDPFAGGGALPLEAQRLGLEAHASDLNPVAVMINKAMIEIPPRFAGRPPINPEARKDKQLFKKTWRGAAGLAEDVRYYGQWMRDEAEKRIGHLYPKAKVTAEMAKGRPDLKPYVGRELTVIAWLRARTVESSNPAYRGCHVPLVSSFWLSTKAGKETWLEPVVDGKTYRFEVRTGKPRDKAAVDAGTKLGRGANFRCVLSQSPLSPDYIKAEGMAERMGARLMAIVCEGDRGRVYLPPIPEHEEIARQAKPVWQPEQEFFQQALGFRIGGYGMSKWSDLFTPRQLTALTTFSDLVAEAREKILQDFQTLEKAGEKVPTVGNPADYASAVSVYLAFALDRLAMTGNNLVRWNAVGAKAQHCFGRQALPMLWDFAEVNFLADATGSISASVFYSCDPLRWMTPGIQGSVWQADAAMQDRTTKTVISTDPPYYDNVGYADLSDFFYVWLRPALREVYPDLFATLTVPKADELVATPYRHGSKEKAEAFFLDGMTKAVHAMAERTCETFPVTIYYAFKQAEGDADGTASTGWETFLDAVIRAGFAITGTWPMHTEMETRMRSMSSNALASSIVIVCRPRPSDAPLATRKDFLAALRRELPPALRHLQEGNIAPVDLAQASIGPGMAVFSRYSRVLETDGKPMTVRTALQLINQTLDETLAEQEGDFDPETAFAVAWFEQFGFNDGPFGDAETLSKAKNTALNALSDAEIVKAGAGKTRLLRVDELPKDWDPTTDKRLTVWEAVHHLIRVMNAGGEAGAAELVARLGGTADAARELAYRLYSVCERRKRATEALTYNALVQSWPEITRLAREGGKPKAVQGELL